MDYSADYKFFELTGIDPNTLEEKPAEEETPQDFTDADKRVAFIRER